MTKKCKRTAIGLVTGFANGLFGSGGGTIVVPAMERFLGEEEHKAHATAIAVILPLSLLSLGVYLWKADLGAVWRIALWASAGGLVGGFVGAKLLQRVSGVQEKSTGRLNSSCKNNICRTSQLEKSGRNHL